jgi:dCTP deaminase
MILADESIRQHIEVVGDLGVDPYDPTAVQPASIDLRLGVGAYYSKPNEDGSHVDPALAQDITGSFVHQPLASAITLLPGDFVIATTLERVTLPNNIVAVVNGKSSLGRLGLLIHATAGFIDPGFSGQITLELSNVSRNPLLLRSGMRVCQLSCQWLDRPSQKPYGHVDLNSKYVDQDGATLSRYDQNTNVGVGGINI